METWRNIDDCLAVIAHDSHFRVLLTIFHNVKHIRFVAIAALFGNGQCDKSRKLSGKAGALLISLLLIFTVTVSGIGVIIVTTTFYPTLTGSKLRNGCFTADMLTGIIDTPSQVSCEVTENFNGTTKSNVNVTNTSDIDAYIPVSSWIV